MSQESATVIETLPSTADVKRMHVSELADVALNLAKKETRIGFHAGMEINRFMCEAALRFATHIKHLESIKEFGHFGTEKMAGIFSIGTPEPGEGDCGD